MLELLGSTEICNRANNSHKSSMNLSSKEADLVFDIMAEMSGSASSEQLRLRIGHLLLDLMDADQFASYVWDDNQGVFGNRVAINMADDNLNTYEQYFQFHDPITPLLQKRRKATPVCWVMSQEKLERTEFYNDFLSRDGLRFGINFHAHSCGRNIGDLRIWRSRGKENFSKRDVELLDAIGVSFINSLKNCMIRESSGQDTLGMKLACIDGIAQEYNLTAREAEIVFAIISGRSDKEIAHHLCISFSTVRTHIKRVFSKLEVKSRTQLANKVSSH